MAIGVGILGFAHGHVNAYCGQWQQHPGFEIKVVAGWDHNPARLDNARKAYDFQPCATAEELLARADVEAVVIAAETSLHAGLVEQAAAAGKKIAGVCTGLSEYANIDVTLVRVIFVVLVLGFGTAILAYVILWIAAPIVPDAHSAGWPSGGGTGNVR